MPVLRTSLKHMTELCADEVQTLRSLTMGFEGSMEDEFLFCLEDRRGWVVIHYDFQHKIDGWCLLFDDYFNGSGRWVAYFYVDEGARGHGVGTAIMKHARLIEPEPIVYPWDERSLRFFRAQRTVATTRFSDYSTRLGRSKAGRFVKKGEALQETRV